MLIIKFVRCSSLSAHTQFLPEFWSPGAVAFKFWGRRMCINITFAGGHKTASPLRGLHSGLATNNSQFCINFIAPLFIGKSALFHPAFIALLQCRTIISSFATPGIFRGALKIIPLHKFIDFIYSYTEIFLCFIPFLAVRTSPRPKSGLTPDCSPPPRNCVKFYILMLLQRHNCSKNGQQKWHTHTHSCMISHFQFHFPTATQWVLLATLEIYNREIINTIWYITHPSRGGAGAFGGQILQPPFLCGVIFAIFPCVRVCVSFF